jgi:hypothetical protein
VGGANNPTNIGGDLCWRTDNAFLSLNGGGGELIRDDDTGEWRIKNDDASKVEKLTGASNGDNNGEYWRVTTAGGVKYYFGLNRLPGYGSGDAETGSTSTVPVFGNHSGEPCHANDFDDSWCEQAWRWRLDWVVDPHGNAIAYFYRGETNHYLLNLDDTPVEYDRAANLVRVDYGLRSGDGYAGATNRVVFNHAARCLPDDHLRPRPPGELAGHAAGPGLRRDGRRLLEHLHAHVLHRPTAQHDHHPGESERRLDLGGPVDAAALLARPGRLHPGRPVARGHHTDRSRR